MEYTDEQILKLINQHKKKRAREHNKYHDELKVDPEWRKLNCEKSKIYYDKNKEQYKEKYLSNQEYIKIRNLYRYYLRNERLNDFKSKYPEKIQYLKDKGYIKNIEESPTKNIQDLMN